MGMLLPLTYVKGKSTIEMSDALQFQVPLWFTCMATQTEQRCITLHLNGT